MAMESFLERFWHEEVKLTYPITYHMLHKSLELPLLGKRVGQKQYHTSGRVSELSVTSRTWRMQGWWYPPHPRAAHPFGLCGKQMALREWQWLINQVLTRTAATVLDVVPLLEEVNTSLVPDMQLLTWQMFFAISKADQKRLALSGQWSTFHYPTSEVYPTSAQPCAII